MTPRELTTLKAARKWIADDLALYFNRDGERMESTKDFDLTEQTKLLDEIDETLKIARTN